MQHDFTDEELSQMSDEERAALDDPEDEEGTDNADDDPEDVGAAAATDDADPNADPNRDGSDIDGAGDPAAADDSDIDNGNDSLSGGAADPAISGEGDDGAAQAAEQQIAKDPEPVAAAAKELEPPVDPAIESQKKVNAIDIELAGLGEQMENGDIDFAEYHKKQLDLNNERMELYREVDKQKIFKELAAQEDARAWTNAQNDFFAKDGNAAIKDKPLLYNALNAAIKQVTEHPEANGKAFDWVLNQAKAEVETQLGVRIGTTPAAAPAPKRHDAGKTQLPMTLSNLPSAAAQDVGTDEFGHLDKMEGMDLELALAELPPEKVDRYLSGESSKVG